MGQPRFASVGPLAAASATNIRTASAVLAAGAVVMNGTLVTDGVATLDKARRVLFTTTADETTKSVLVTGTNGSGSVISETLTLGNATGVPTLLDYKTVTSVVASAALTGNLSIGTNGVAASNWVQFDHSAVGGVAIQCTVTGTANYTVQQTLDDPNSSISPVAPASVTWVNSADAAVVAATATQQSNYAFPPVWARILLNSGSGSVAGTFIPLG